MTRRRDIYCTISRYRKQLVSIQLYVLYYNMEGLLFMKEFTITYNEAGQRFDKYLSKMLPEASASFYYKMLRKKNITLNGKKADGKEKIKQGDVVRFFLADDTFAKFAGEKKKEKNIPKLSLEKSGLKVLYEDEDILAFDKPAGLLSQKAKPADISVNDYLIAYLREQEDYDHQDSFLPSICNRLDRNTSGIILCGKSLTGSMELGRMLKERSLKKYYRCIVLGNVTADKLVGYIRKDEKTNKIIFSPKEFEGSSRVETSWKPVKSLTVLGESCTELEVHLITGKTHQIRGHLAGIGHPLIGDCKYGNRTFNDRCRKAFGVQSQMLHACRVVFPEDAGKLKKCSGRTIRAELPENFLIIKER